MSPPRRFPWFVVVLAIVIVITGICAVFFWPRPPGPAAPATAQSVTLAETPRAAPAIQTASVVRRDFKASITAHGTVQASRDILVAPKISAPVAAIRASVGDDVAEGDVLLELDRSALEIQRAQALATLRAAESQLARLEAGARPEELEQVEAQVAQAEASLQHATDELARLRALYRSGAVTLSQLEQAETQVKVAEAQLAALLSQLSLVRQGARSEDLDAARAQVEQARAGVSLAELHLSYAEVTAPIAGRIAARHIDIGEYAQAGAPVFRIVQLDPIVVKSQVGARDVVRISRGAEVIVRVDALPGEVFRGTVSLVDSAADAATRLYGIEASLPNPGFRLLPGMSGDVEIVIARSEGALAVPQAAVRERDGSYFVYVIDNSTVLERPILTGIADGTWVEVLSGLAEGERVVTSGFEALRHGMRIDGSAGE